MYITPFTNLFSTSIVNCLQSPKEVFVRGLVNLVHAVDYLFCLNLPSASSQLRTKTLCWLCMFMKTKYAMISRFQSDLSFVTIEQIISSIHILRKCKIPRKFPFPMKLFLGNVESCIGPFESSGEYRRSVVVATANISPPPLRNGLQRGASELCLSLSSRRRRLFPARFITPTVTQSLSQSWPTKIMTFCSHQRQRNS